MRRPGLLVLIVLAACSSRTADYPQDYTEEVERICEDLCEKAATCTDPPLAEYDECMVECTQPGGMHDDTVCGEAFRVWYGCVAGTASCEEYLDSFHVNAPDYPCKEEGVAAGALKCGAQEGMD